MRWTAIWAPDRARMFWQLTVTDEAGNVAMEERSDAPLHSPHPRDGFLIAIGLSPAGEWAPGGDGSVRAPVLASEERAEKLVDGLLARGRSDPGARARR